MKKLIYLSTVVLLFICQTTINAQRYYGYESHYKKDSTYFEGTRYAVTDLYKLGDDHKIRLKDGDSYGDSTWFKHKWISNEKYNSVYYFETSFMPGFVYQYYVPKRSDSVGAYSGLAVEYLFYGKVHNNDDDGPSHARFYGKIGLMSSTKENERSILNMSLGLTLSLEKNPERVFLVPDFGIESGCFVQNKQATAYVIAMAGIQFYAMKNMFVGANGGYMYTLSNIYVWSGYYGQVNVDFSFW